MNNWNFILARRGRSGEARGFTLLELLVVIGVIAALSFFLFGALTGGGKAAVLQSGQATLANLVTAARIKATASGHKVRLLVAVDPVRPDHYLRLIVLQLGRQAGASPADWDSFQAVTLPAGCYVVPAALTGLVANPAMWKRASDPSDDLASDLFVNQNLVYAREGESATEAWTGVAFTPNGTLAALAGGPPPRGSIILALGQMRAPGSVPPDQPGVLLNDPPAVRGLVLSAYGVPAWLNEREAF